MQIRNALHLFTGIVYRAVTLSNKRLLSHHSRNGQFQINEIGIFEQQRDQLHPYERGQLFVHKIFAYRGILILSTDCKVYTRNSVKIKQTMEIIPYYQVLIHSDDWNEINFLHNLTTCLHSNGTGEQKNLAEYNGIDIVSHDEISPYKQCVELGTSDCEKENLPPINNEYYSHFFKQADDNITPGSEGLNNDVYLPLPLKYNAMLPQAVFKQTTDNIEVQVVPFYLGSNLKQGHNFHLWRCLFRISNLEKRTIEIKERKLQTSSMSGEYSHMDPSYENGILTKRKRLTPTKSVTQFTSHFEMPCQKGNNLWGHFMAEDNEGRVVKAIIPTISLEGQIMVPQEQIEIIK